jgi:hypothetical protein
MGLLNRLRVNRHLPESRGVRVQGNGPAGRLAELKHLIHVAADTGLRKIFDYHRMMMAGPFGREAEEFSIMRKGRLSPGFDNDLVALVAICTGAFFIRTARPKDLPKNLGLARLSAAADPKLEPSAAQYVDHRGLLGQTNGMPPRQDVGTARWPAALCRYGSGALIVRKG